MLMRSQGRAVWRRFNATLAAGTAADARDPRRGTRDPGRRTAGHARVRHRRLRPDAVAAADASARASPAGTPDLRPRRPRDCPRLEQTAPRRRARIRRRGQRHPRSATRHGCRDRRFRLDAPHTEHGNGFSDALTCAFGDPTTGVCGVARLGLADGRRSGLAIVFRDGAAVAVSADGGVETSARSWDDVAAAGLTDDDEHAACILAAAVDGERRLELTFDAIGPSSELGAGSPSAAAGGMEGFDHFCRVRGTVDGSAFDGLGQRSRAWGAPDWERMTLARTMSAWIDADPRRQLTAIRPCRQARAGLRARGGVRSFDSGMRRAGGPRGRDRACRRRYDGEGRQRRAGLELWVGEQDELGRAARAGEVVVRNDARPRAAAIGLRILPLADGGPRGLRPLRRPTAGLGDRQRPDRSGMKKRRSARRT